MKRRAYLATVLSVTGTAGCLQFGGDDGTNSPGADSDGGGDGGGDGGDGADPDDGTATGTTTEGGASTTPSPEETTRIDRESVELPLPKSELSRGAPKDAIPAITEPAFASNWADADLADDNQTLTLRDSNEVIAVEREGEARAYPLRVLNWHEIVNDNFHGPLLVTFCPLCGSGMTAVRTVDGSETVFGVSGYLWQSDLVMYDRKTESLWSQIMATAIRGPKTETTLELVPSSITTWGQFKADHPDGEVLLPSPSSKTVNGEVSRRYALDPYSGYSQSSRIGIGENEFDDDRLHPKTEVIGVTHDGTAKAYPLTALEDEPVINDDVNGLPVVVAKTGSGSMFAYERTVDDETLSFSPASDSQQHMTGGGSRWKISSGTAVDGPHEGTRLVQANDKTTMFWFAWLDFHEDTLLYGES